MDTTQLHAFAWSGNEDPIPITYDCNHTHYPVRYRDETTQNRRKAARADNKMVYRDASFVYSQLVTSLRGPSSTKLCPGVRSKFCPPDNRT